MRFLQLSWILILAGCGSDVALGTYALDAEILDSSVRDGSPDGSVDAATPDVGFADSGDAGELDSGTQVADGGVLDFTMRISGTSTTACFDSLEGQEWKFTGLGPAEVGVSEGPVRIEFGPRVDGPHRISGHPLSISFGRTGILLTHPLSTDVPSGVCLSETISGSGIAGPLDTTLGYFGLGIDMSTLTPYSLYGFLVALYLLPDMSGACQVAFDVEFTIP